MNSQQGRAGDFISFPDLDGSNCLTNCHKCCGNTNLLKIMVFAIDLIRFSSELLKRLSEVGIKTGDYNYIEMYDNYIDLLNKYGKKNYAKRKVSEHYGISESTVNRIVSRFERSVKI